ncbi:MAG: type II/IV secretion system ATPase subunit [Candidatus Nezhaarchaeales archaeon]
MSIKRAGDSKGLEQVELARLRDFYAVNPPFCHIAIVMDPVGKLRYEVVEPTLLQDEVEVVRRVKEFIKESVDVDVEDVEDPEKARSFIVQATKKVIKKYGFKVASEALDKILYYIVRDLLGYGKIDGIVRDPNIEDISCAGVGIPIYVWHVKYEELPTNVSFESEEELNSFVMTLSFKAKQQVSIARPVIDGVLPEGHRVHLTLDVVSKRGSTFTIRKYRPEKFTIIDLIKLGTLSSEVAAYLWIMVEQMRSMLICGATASGKTTLLNAIAALIRPEAKVITIEETRELMLPHENWVPLVTRPSTTDGAPEISAFDLLKSALRQRPDYIIVGEVRGEEAYALFQAVATGHGGLCTIHAENIEAAIRRLESKPMNVPRELIPMIETIILVARRKVRGVTVRRVIEVNEVTGIDPRSGEIMINPIYRWDPLTDSFTRLIADGSIIVKRLGFDNVTSELENRKVVLEWMLKKDLSRHDDVAKVIRSYYLKPRETYERARSELLKLVATP